MNLVVSKFGKKIAIFEYRNKQVELEMISDDKMYKKMMKDILESRGYFVPIKDEIKQDDGRSNFKNFCTKASESLNRYGFDYEVQ